MKDLYNKIKEEIVIIKESFEYLKRYKRISITDLDYLTIIDGKIKPVDVEMFELKLTPATASKYINKVIEKSDCVLYLTNTNYIYRLDTIEDEPVDLVEEPQIYILLDEDKKPLLIWDNITAIFSYQDKLKNFIDSQNEVTYEPYFSIYFDTGALRKDNIFIQHHIVSNQSCSYDLDYINDRLRTKLLIDKMNVTRSIFINDNEVMKYIKAKKYQHRKTEFFVIIDEKVDSSALIELIGRSLVDGNYMLTGILICDYEKKIDLNSFGIKDKVPVFNVTDEKVLVFHEEGKSGFGFNLER